MSVYLVAVLRPLFELDPRVVLPPGPLAALVGLVAVATLVSAAAGSRVIARLEPTELRRDE